MAALRVPGHRESPRTVLRMRSGRQVHLYDPSPLDIDLDDWVVGCSRVVRWGGQTRGDIAYNDLVHMMLTERILVSFVWPKASAKARLWALAHDLHEGGGLGDIVSPFGMLFKQAGLDDIKLRIDQAIRLAIGLSAKVPDKHYLAIKKADRIAAVSEAIQLMDWPEREARRDIGRNYRGQLWEDQIHLLGEKDAREAWWERYRLLGGRLSATEQKPSDKKVQSKPETS